VSGWWGGGWGNHTPSFALEFAKAFWAGETKRRDKYERGYRAGKDEPCEKSSYVHVADGEYKLYGHTIARCTPHGQEHVELAKMLRGEKHRKPFEFSFAGYPTPTTARHLSVLGLRAEVHGIKSPVCTINGVLVDPSAWYTLDDLRTMKTLKQIQDEERTEKERKRAAREAKCFVNLTLPLPFDAHA
jgi:hypothetical protein